MEKENPFHKIKRNAEACGSAAFKTTTEKRFSLKLHKTDAHCDFGTKQLPGVLRHP